MTRRTVPAVLGVLLAALVGIWAWARVPIPTIDAGGTSPPILTTLPSSPTTGTAPAAGSSATTTSTAAPSPSVPAGLPGYPGVLATAWPGPATWGYQGEITSGPPMYPPADVPVASSSCPWSATDAEWAQSAMTTDADDDLQTWAILSKGEGFQYGWDEFGRTIALYQQVSQQWGEIAGWINALCFPSPGGAASQPPTSADVAEAVTWLQSGAASHPGSDAWSVSWRDSYNFVTAMFEEIR